VTVPGKGGRPRKWLSEGDRVRAYRARQRGDVEPPTVEQASASDDALARAIQRQEELEVLLADARREIRALARETRAAEASVDRLNAELAPLRRERADLLRDVAELNERVRRLPVGAIDTNRHEPAQLLNRAARRRQAKRRR
jgi:chromosome segregation ATPase